VIRFARGRKFSPEAIVSSRYVRARQTADIAAKLLGVAEVRESRNLLPSGKPSALWRELQRISGIEQVLLVGHEPQMSNFLAFLIGGAGRIDIKKGALLRIQVSAAGAQLKWMIVPALVR